MKYIGAHVSISGGISNAPLEAAAIGAKAFALFTGSSSRWVSKEIPDTEIELFKSNCKANGYKPEVILPHDNFLINLGSPDSQKLHLSRKSFLDEMHRCEQLGLTMLNFHPGSHLNIIEPNDCLKRIAESINLTLDKTTGVCAVLENVAGQGTNLGHSFEQLAYIINLIDDKTRIGVCIDTCHAFSAGFNLSNYEGYNKTWNDFDSIIGRNYLKALHLNDSKKPFNSRIDRHESIGQGTLGKDFFKRLINDARFDNIPIILETPDETRWPEEIKWLYSLQKDS